MPVDTDPFADPTDVSPVAKEFARRYAPRLAAELTANKAAIVAASGNWLMRQAVSTAWPIILRLIPRGVESGADAGLDEFGSMSLTEVASKLLAHNQAKGRRSHPSLHERHD